MRKFVAVVICCTAVGSGVASASSGGALRTASQRSGLSVRRPVPTLVESPAHFTADAMRALDRSYPRKLREFDAELYVALGLLPGDRTVRSALVSGAAAPRAEYDPVTHVLRVRRTPAPPRSELVHEFVRALVDQNFGLRRLTTLRARDRDAAFAASATIDGIASLASGQRATPLRRDAMQRFLATERSVGSEAGRTLIARLREIGGPSAVASALRAWPRTTEQLLHVDKFLQRERALPIPLPRNVRDLELEASETFGELDVRALLAAFGLPGAASVADGWAGGRVALYRSTAPHPTVVLVLRWDTGADASEWRAIGSRYVAAAFPTLQAHVCPAVDGCWLEGDHEVALDSAGRITALASGPNAELLAAVLLQHSPSS